MNQPQYIEETISFGDLATRLGITDLDTPAIYDIRDEEYEILSFDHATSQETWSPLNAYVVKANADEHYQANTLHGTKDHRIWVDGEYVRLEDYAGAELVKQPIQVVDCEVGNTHNYLAEGFVNHNTTTPGGMAIPYACSTRIQITSTGQSHIKDAKGNIIGINVKAKTIKNKVAPPFRSVEFQIHFGKGVVEHEEVFDAFRLACEARKANPIIVNDRIVNIEGTGAWKTFSLADAATGEFEKEVKFYKHEFGEKVLYVPEFAPYMEELYSATFVTTYDKLKEHATYEGLNENSYEEAYQAKIDQAEQMVLND